MAKSERLPLAISLSVLVCLLHLPPLLVIALSINQYFESVEMNAPYIMESRFALIFHDELVLPLVRFPADDWMILKYVNLKTSAIRYSKPTSAVLLRGMVSDGKRLWVLGGRDEIYETDGADEQTYTTTRALMTKKFFSGFLYQGRPAIIDRGADDVHRLLVLENRNWVERGQIGVPGKNRSWTIDQRTGQQILVPRLFENEPIEKVPSPYLHIVSAAGECHLFQIEDRQKDLTDAPDYRIAYRHGFDFKSLGNQDPDEAASALAPYNIPLDTTGWQLLQIPINPFFADIVIHKGQLFGVRQRDQRQIPEIYRIIPGQGFGIPERTDVVTNGMEPIDLSGRVGLIQSADEQQLYAIHHPRMGEATLYRWEGNQFIKQSIVIDGAGTPLVRKAGIALLQIVGTFWLGTLATILAATWLIRRTDEVSCSFGIQTVRLASLNGRAAARCIDLGLIFGPPAWQLYRTLSGMNSHEILEMFNMGQFSPLCQDVTLKRALVWAADVWFILVTSTAICGLTPGKWICGLRVCRTTLRRSGFARSLARELLMWLDAPLLLTAVPGVFACLMTTRQQRTGDIVADTIVVVAGSEHAERDF